MDNDEKLKLEELQIKLTLTRKGSAESAAFEKAIEELRSKSIINTENNEAMQETISLLSHGNEPRLLDAVNDIKQRRKLKNRTLVET
jgi:hypothetical protein